MYWWTIFLNYNKVIKIFIFRLNVYWSIIRESFTFAPPLKYHNQIHFHTRKDIEVENRGIFTAPKGDDWWKTQKNKIKKYTPL